MHSYSRGIIPLGALALFAWLHLSALPAARAASAPAKVDSIDELYEKAKKEGGKLNLYASLSANSIEVILPAFMKRFPGITVTFLPGPRLAHCSHTLLNVTEPVG